LSRIAIVGIGCQYPEADSPAVLWRNVLAERRSFREIPAERFDLADYYSADRSVPDATYSRIAAVLDDYQFDRLSFSIPGPLFRSSDMVHWLALDVARRALDDAGFDQLPVDRRRVAVLIGNILTGDYTRSNVMRVRWPYVRRTVVATLAAHGLSARLADVLPDLERAYKQPFGPNNEESLAGGLSNTISGRICNYFDFGGGGYTIDGACSSSLLSIIHASIALQRRDVDFALAGGVDLSIDPFELVGFAKTSALADGLMRIYDVRSEGFWPGEGCGIVALVREDDAEQWELPVYAFISGFGVSSDGHGGITRPEVQGHALALHRAYDLAGYGPDTVSLFEGHGTGTPVGDAAEVAAISAVRREAGASGAAALGSIKANIGHTKAAAGVAGLTKAVMSVHSGVIPPTTGCESAIETLTSQDRMLEIRRTAAPWPDGIPRRAAVSAIGFGGINTHITIEQSSTVARGRLWPVGSAVASTAQDAELLPFTAPSLSDLAGQCRRMSVAARELTFGRMSDLAISAARDLMPGRPVRAAVIARTPADLADRCAQLAERIETGSVAHIGAEYAFSASTTMPRIGYLFSGQGSPVRFTAGALGRRFAIARQIVETAALDRTDRHDTATAQPAIVTASAAALAVLDEIGLEACVSVGHSLGELAALHWAGAFSFAELVDLAKTRGRAMSACGPERGSMVQLGTDEDGARELMAGLPLSVAAINAQDLTVLSGPEVAVQAAARRAATRRIPAATLKVSHAFHSPLVAASAATITAWFAARDAERALRRPVVSTVTGALLPDRVALSQLLAEQVTAPVLFTAALETAAARCDLLIEVGPGRILADLCAPTGVPALTVDAGAESIASFLSVVGAAFALGSPVALEALVRNRACFSTDPLRRPTYLANPCELIDKQASAFAAPASQNGAHAADAATAGQPPAQAPLGSPASAPASALASTLTAPNPSTPDGDGSTANGNGTADGNGTATDMLEIVRELVAARTELPSSAISESSAFLADLNLNSIAVAEIAAEAARTAHRQLTQAPHELTEGSVRELVELLRQSPAGDADAGVNAAGVADWVRTFTVVWTPRRRGGLRRAGNWQLTDGSGDSRDSGDSGDSGDSLRAIFADGRAGSTSAGKGVVIALDEIVTESSAWQAIDTLARVARDREVTRVVICHAGGAASLARTLYLERPDLVVRLIRAEDIGACGSDELRQLIRRECETGDGFEELRFTDSLEVLVPRLAQTRIDGGHAQLSADDTVLVSGGGKGIGAEAALSIGKQFGVKVAIIGRSDAQADDEIQATLARMTALGIGVQYEQADVTDGVAVRAAVGRIAASLGPITGIMHSAGTNQPALLTALTPESAASTWRSKVDGLTNLIEAVDPGRLCLLVAFGSTIGRAGLRGEAHYAIANERLRAIVEAFAAEHPQCKSLAIEWSAWSEVGMGAKLGIIGSLAQFGVRPISPEDAIRTLLALIAADAPETAPIVTGRFGMAARTLPMGERDVPFFRFIENPLVHYPGIELVAEATLAGETDKYLADHALDGLPLLPAVAGIEAMAQVAQALTGGDRVSRILNLRLAQPITVPVSGSRRIRIAGLVRAGGLTDVSVRSDETDFGVEHLTATYSFDEDLEPAGPAEADGSARPDRPDLLPDSSDIVSTLYRDLLFHGPAFQRVQGYRQVESAKCRADVGAGVPGRWFIDYLPADTVLGDPATRDACLHAAQACIPHRRVLPVSADEIRFHRQPQSAIVDVESVERSRGDRELVFDLTVRDGTTGEVAETWSGLKLSAVGDLAWSRPLPPDVLAAYAERALSLRWGADLTCRVAIKDTSAVSRESRGELAVALATGGTQRLSHQPDGKPELASGLGVSLSHHAQYTLVLLSDRPVGADLESVEHRPESTWAGMLGPGPFSTARLLAGSGGEDLDTGATRVWSAIECLRKLGVTGEITLAVEDPPDPPDAAWVTLTAGTTRIFTVTARVAGVDATLVVAAAAGTATDSSDR
jgi:enediyne polyketide synthase